MPEPSSDAETAPEHSDGAPSPPSPERAQGSESESAAAGRSGAALLRTPPSATQSEPGEAPFGVWDAVRSSLSLVIITIVVFAAAGAAVAFVRHQKYSASTRLAVLHLDFGTPGTLGGFSTAGPVLADTYARAITADGVIDPLAARFHASPATIRGELAAAAVPESPVFEVTATTGSSATAIALANAATAQLVKYLQSVNSADPDAAKLLKALSKAELSVNVLAANKNALQSAISSSLARRGGAPAPMSSAQRMQLATAAANLSVAVDEATSVRAAYQQSITGNSNTQFLQQLSVASSATGDRRSKLELLVFAGVAVGLGLGVALALLRAARRTRTRASS